MIGKLMCFLLKTHERNYFVHTGVYCASTRAAVFLSRRYCFSSTYVQKHGASRSTRTGTECNLQHLSMEFYSSLPSITAELPPGGCKCHNGPPTARSFHAASIFSTS